MRADAILIAFRSSWLPVGNHWLKFLGLFQNRRPIKTYFNVCFQEESLRKSGEPKYAHLSMELHVFIEVFAPAPEGYMRMAHAMEEVKKFLSPVSIN